MTVNIRKGMFMGGVGAAAVVGVLFLFLPVVPVAFSGTATAPLPATQAAPCAIPQPTQNSWFTMKYLNVGNLSFVFGSNVYTADIPPQTHGGGDLQPTNAHVTNVTLTVDIQGAKIVRDNGSLRSFLGQEFVNRSLDSSFFIQRLVVQTTRFNATADRISLTIAHVAVQIGPYFAKHQNGGPFTTPMSFTFDNFRLGLIYNCKTGKVSYAASFQVSPISIASAAVESVLRRAP